MSTITTEQENAIRAYFTDRHIPVGLGSEEQACSIAGINLALSGRLTDTVPDCMSNVIGRWIIRIQDRMPDEIRNSPEWRRLLPLAAGTGRTLERERAAIVLDHMWSKMLPLVQPWADKRGYGVEWLAMTTERTPEATQAARKAAYADEAAAADADAAAAADAYAAAARLERWNTQIDPCALLQRLIDAVPANA